MGDALNLAGWSVQALADAKARTAMLATDLMLAPSELQQLAEQARASLMSGTGVRAFAYLMILLLVGCGAEWLYWSYAYAPLRSIQSAPSPSPRDALRTGMRRLALLACGVVIFTLATIGASALFSWPPGVQELVVAATLLLLVLRLAWIGIATVLAPGMPRLRLVPVEPRRAPWMAATAMAAVTFLALGHFLPDFLERIGAARHAPGALRLAAASLTALLLLIGAFAFFRRPQGRSALFPRSFVLALLVVVVYALWLLSPSVAVFAAIVAIVIALQLGLRAFVAFFWQEAGAGDVLPNIVLSAARFVVVLIGLGACVLALDTPVTMLAASQSPLMRLGLRLLGVATLILLTNVLWICIRTVIDQRLARIRSPDPHAPLDASARLLTLLPLLRVSAAVFLVVMLVLSSLWALGIEITPLMAGAGVVGIALGFGAQALVRDVIAGIFYLAEDAFRIGEYIESGTSIKGAVERITLRTVALRHHNGPLHFVPYGSLGTVRNTSRDWVIEKFNLPLPIDVDSETIRKLIKKVGEELLTDPEIGHMLIEPLKGKLYRIDPGVKLFRCKFRTAPGNQFDVRAQALKRIEAALKKIGVGFADGKQTVLLAAPPA